MQYGRKIVVVMPAYNAARTLRDVYDEVMRLAAEGAAVARAMGAKVAADIEEVGWPEFAFAETRIESTRYCCASSRQVSTSFGDRVMVVESVIVIPSLLSVPSSVYLRRLNP